MRGYAGESADTILNQTPPYLADKAVFLDSLQENLQGLLKCIIFCHFWCIFTSFFWHFACLILREVGDILVLEIVKKGVFLWKI